MPQSVHAAIPKAETHSRSATCPVWTAGAARRRARRSPAEMAVSSTPTTYTMTTLPMKYAAGGIGVPTNRLSTPRSRSNRNLYTKGFGIR